jgi:hypothetical protein
MTGPVNTVNTVNMDAIITTCETLFRPGDVVELRIPDAPRKGTVAGYFDDWEKLAKAAALFSGKAPSVYITLNPVNPALLARCANRVQEFVKQGTGAQDADIVHRRWLLVDFDPVRPAHISSNEEEHLHSLDVARAAYRKLCEMGWRGILAADSGNGAHLLVPVDLPNDEASTLICQNVLAGLGAQYDDDTVKVDRKTFNAARICTLYGTLKCKGDSTEERPHRMARLLKGAGK